MKGNGGIAGVMKVSFVDKNLIDYCSRKLACHLFYKRAGIIGPLDPISHIPQSQVQVVLFFLLFSLQSERASSRYIEVLV